MAQNKTKATDASVAQFLAGVSEKQRADAETVLELMQQASGEPPKLWGSSIVGFGDHHYVYESGREGDWFLTGFSPRKQALSIYVMAGCETFPDLMQKLGKYKTGKSCLYVKSLDDIDLPALKAATRQEIHRRLALAVDLVHSSYERDIDLAEMAAAACLSKFHFLRLFTGLYGVTPHLYLQRKRAQVAARLLQHSGLATAQVAARVGFQSRSTMARHLRALQRGRAN